MRAGQSGVAYHGVFLHFFQAAGLAHPDAFIDVFQKRDHLPLGQMGAEEDRPLPLGEPRPAPVAAEQAARGTRATANDQIPGTALTVIRTLGIDATEMAQVIHDLFLQKRRFDGLRPSINLIISASRLAGCTFEGARSGDAGQADSDGGRVDR